VSYRLSVKARIDLQEIWNYTVETWSIEQADHYVNLLLDVIENIASNPHNRFVRKYSGTKFLCFQAESHLIFYRRLRRSPEIEIIRVLHKRMDIGNRLQDLI